MLTKGGAKEKESLLPDDANFISVDNKKKKKE